MDKNCMKRSVIIVIKGGQIKEDDFGEELGTAGGEGNFGWKI